MNRVKTCTVSRYYIVMQVYQPCILQTKKRYVGYMYESPDQEKPVYEAKGIETVRRDGCPAGVKVRYGCHGVDKPNYWQCLFLIANYCN